MSSEEPSFETRLSHRAAEAYAMPVHCSRRSCRRTGRCQGAVSATFEPDCVAPLSDTQRRTFAACISITHDFARLIQSGGNPVIDRDSQTAYIQNFCLTVALGAFAELPRNRKELRRYIRRIGYRPLGRPPRGLSLGYRIFPEPEPEACPAPQSPPAGNGTADAIGAQTGGAQTDGAQTGGAPEAGVSGRSGA